MSRYATVTRPILHLAIDTTYVDDVRVSRSRKLQWGVGPIEGLIELRVPRRLRSWLGIHHQFSVRYVPHDPNDNEGIREKYFAKNAPYKTAVKRAKIR